MEEEPTLTRKLPEQDVPWWSQTYVTCTFPCKTHFATEDEFGANMEEIIFRHNSVPTRRSTRSDISAALKLGSPVTHRGRKKHDTEMARRMDPIHWDSDWRVACQKAWNWYKSTRKVPETSRTRFFQLPSDAGASSGEESTAMCAETSSETQTSKASPPEEDPKPEESCASEAECMANRTKLREKAALYYARKGQRKYVLDSGASYHQISFLSPADEEKATVHDAEEVVWMQTASKPIKCDKMVWLFVPRGPPAINWTE